MNAKALLAFVSKECKKHKVKFSPLKVAGIDSNGIIVNGYFSSDKGEEELAVATGQEEARWVRLLMHEFCHLKQWAENCKVWRECYVDASTCDELFDHWLNHNIELTDKQKKKIFLPLMEVEADCERRVLKLARKLKIEIDEEEYAQKANAYILFYFHVMKTRKWYKVGQEPYNNKEIYGKMPKKIIKNLKRVNPKLLTYFD